MDQKCLKKNTKGFTLIEVILIFMVLAILSVAALSNFFATNKELEFLAEFRQVLSSIRNVRSAAVNNLTFEDDLPARYGLYFSLINDSQEIQIIPFVDNGSNEMAFDPAEDDKLEKGQVMEGDIEDDKLGSSLILPKDFELEFWDKDLIKPFELPVLIFYETGSGDFSIYSEAVPGALGDIIDKKSINYIKMKLKRGDLENLIGIYQVSGLAEAVNQ